MGSGIEDYELGKPSNDDSGISAIAIESVGSVGNEAGSGKRKRGRPRVGPGGNSRSDGTAETETESVVSVRTPRKRRSSKTEIPPEKLGQAIAGIFAIIALVRGQHWAVDEETATDLVGEPLAEVLESMSDGTGKAVAKALAPMTLAIGCSALLAKPLQVESQILREKIANGKQNPIARGQQKAYPTNAGSNGVAGSNHNRYTEPERIFNEDIRPTPTLPEFDTPI